MNPTSPFDHPWDYLGEAKSPVQLDALPKLNGAFDAWDTSALYTEGDVVVHRGKAYSAAWTVAVTAPEFEPARPFDHPWRYLGEATESST